MSELKTPLRYPGGKSRAVKKMAQWLPDMKNYSEYREPFIGGGSFALYLAQMYPHLDIWINDLYEPLYNFWCELRDNGDEITKQLVQLKQRHPDPSSAKVLFLESKEYLTHGIRQTNATTRAVAFYIVNKCSFSGLTESSSFSRQASDSNFSMRGIDRLKYYRQIIKDWKITNLSYEELMTDNKEVFVYLDPPYDIKDNLYGRKGSMHKGFDHDKFAADCDRFVCPQMISYNTAQVVKDRFTDYNAYEYDLTYTMRSVGDYMKEQHDRKELLLTNYGV
ncbi:putative cytosine specific DNA methyl transferase [Synechococcus phage syn9]|uniref:site-specific DNA-methyltransferase (adenine-specific) n=1 Tax=Synechococcus phage syn9 TaxID=382359 RepID=Q0QZ67_BPSYS|nr:DNA methyltransferase [Synechococcus phage syn9]ABA47129.1 putative cytosine specific DNA methyl transferase [Synechococcus phage syn9]AGH56519.1 Dam [Cyanophage Syn10]